MVKTLLLIASLAAATFAGRAALTTTSSPTAAVPTGEFSPREHGKVSVLTGRVTDDHGKPLSGVKVQLYSGIATRFHGQSTTTDATGVYRFDPLETGAGSTGGFYTGIQLEHPDLVSADGQDWWDVIVPHGQLVVKDFSLIKGGRIAGSLTFGSGQWGLNEFPLRFASTEKPNPKRVAYVTTKGGPGGFTSPALFPGEYDVTWNSAYPQSGQIIRVKVEAGKTTIFKANLIFEMKAETTETPVTK